VAGAGDEYGRGLFIVNAVASRWGTADGGDGADGCKTMWSELDL